MLVQTVSKKAVDRTFAKLKSRLDSDDMAGVAEVLDEAATSELLVRVREQKLVLRPSGSQRDTFIRLLRASSAHLAAKEQVEFESYLDFTTEVDAAKNNCIERLHETLQTMPNCSMVDLLYTADEVFEQFVKEQIKRSGQSDSGPSVADGERDLHDLNGAINDITMAVARLVNEYCRIAVLGEGERLCSSDRRLALEVVRQALPHAAEANSLEFFFDSVTYGEFTVERATTQDRLTFIFHFVDTKRYLLKSLAIRRTLVMNFVGRRNARYVREALKRIEEAMLAEAASYYLRRVGASEKTKLNLTRARKHASMLMVAIEAEDDLLVAASRFDPRTLAHYSVAMALRWYALAAEAVRDVPKIPRRRWLNMPPIPLGEVASRIVGAGKEAMAEAIANMTIELPARNHARLVDIPFIRDGQQVARPFLRGQVGIWSCLVRETLIQGGAIGKSVGSTWEDFYAKSFEGTDWKIVGRGVKLRSNGQTLTDVDILLVRDDLLLVMQVKALIGSANGPYDHWRNRQTVEYGCLQARVATTHFEANPSSLLAICGKQLAARIKHIQPVVLTNIDQLDGWRVGDVPVISEVTRKAICRGAQVDYRNRFTGEVVHTHHFVSPEDLNTSSILKLLEETLEMRVASEGTETVHSTHRIGGLTLLMPEFVIRDDIGAKPPHEPDSSLLMQTDGSRSQGLVRR